MAVHNPARCIVGLCPSCAGVIVVTNNLEVWDLATCPCGWAGGTTDIARRVRYSRNSLTGVEDHVELLLPEDRLGTRP
ncbi:MAG: hypothetical protein Q8K63_13765 [Acidimicrobiales bacterium]|nr:hypothetical protein [Acidimicrobiales bacterium]